MLDLDTITIGTDPEFFVEDQAGHVIPAYVALDGDRDVTLPFGVAYPDGAAIEMTVEYDTRPVHIAEKLGENIRAVQHHLGHPLSVRSNGYVAQHYIDMLTPAYGKRASLQVLGCKRDKRVYPWAAPIERPDPRTYEWRTLGGHIHIGVGKRVTKNMALVQFAVAMLDTLIGTAGTYLCDEQESRDRKLLYGKSGTIRITDYGAIEYRSLPSKALTSSYDLAFHMFSLAQKACFFALNVFGTTKDFHGLYTLLGGSDRMRQVSEAIDAHDVATCRAMQLHAASEYDRNSHSPGFMAHIEAMQAMTLPANFSMEW